MEGNHEHDILQGCRPVAAYRLHTIPRCNGERIANNRRPLGARNAMPGGHSGTPGKPAIWAPTDRAFLRWWVPLILVSHRRGGAAGDDRPYQCGRFLGVVRAVVAALLIVAGLALLGEWALDMRRETPVRRSGSFVGILLSDCVSGYLGDWMESLWARLRIHGIGDNDFFNFFGLPEHDFDQPADTRPIPANASIQILDPRGDVSITAADQPNLEVQAHEMAYANSDSDAKKIFDSEAAQGDGERNCRAGAVRRQRSWKSESDGHGAAHGAGDGECGQGRRGGSGLGAGINVTAPHGTCI